MIKVIVLGTAQDAGVPQLGCRAPLCERARSNPAFARWVASLALIDTEASRCFLVDATPDVRPQLEFLMRHPEYPRRADRNPVDGVVLTHAHIGHYTGLVQFGNEVMATRNLQTHCTLPMGAFLKQNGPWTQLVRDGFLRLQTFDPPATLELTPQLSVRAFRVPHRQEWSDTLGLEIRGPNRRLLYISDIDRWSDWHAEIAAEVSNCEIALLDGTFYSGDELPGRDITQVPHPHIAESMQRLASLSAAHHIAFTHLNHTNPVLDADSPQRRELEAAGFHVASDRQEFTL